MLRELQPRRGRMVCVVLSPERASRRRACVSRRRGRLRATLARIDEAGRPAGIARSLPRARLVVRGEVMAVRASTTALRVTLGGVVSWRAYLQWQHGSGCAVAPRPPAGTRLLPAIGALTLRTRASRRPRFTRLHRPRLLATGDSMIQVFDKVAARRARIVSRRAT